MKKNSLILVDTDILIDYLRDHDDAVIFLEDNLYCFHISVITVAEIFAGMRDNEKNKITKLIECFEIFSLTEDIAIKGGMMRRDFWKSHGVGLADALIAATAFEMKCTMATLNKKHFPMLSDVFVPYRKT